MHPSFGAEAYFRGYGPDPFPPQFCNVLVRERNRPCVLPVRCGRPEEERSPSSRKGDGHRGKFGLAIDRNLDLFAVAFNKLAGFHDEKDSSIEVVEKANSLVK